MLLPEPIVSIVMPLYNAEAFLAEAIESILAQTLKEWEFIIVLDGCTDNTESIINHYRDDRFVIIKHETNLGLQIGLNRGLAVARSPFFARMDGDDICEPTRLERQLDFFSANPEVSIVGTYADYINGHGRHTRPYFPFPTTHEEIKNAFRTYNCIAHPTTIIRTERLAAIDGYNPDMTAAEDLELWLRSLARGLKFANIPEILYHYREHASQSSRVRRKLLYELVNQSYRLYGHSIWGDDAPEMDLGAPIYRRAIRKLRRMLDIK